MGFGGTVLFLALGRFLINNWNQAGAYVVGNLAFCLGGSVALTISSAVSVINNGEEDVNMPERDKLLSMAKAS